MEIFFHDGSGFSAKFDSHYMSDNIRVITESMQQSIFGS
jgi:hypothetical protein